MENKRSLIGLKISGIVSLLVSLIGIAAGIGLGYIGVVVCKTIYDNMMTDALLAIFLFVLIWILIIAIGGVLIGVGIAIIACSVNLMILSFVMIKESSDFVSRLYGKRHLLGFLTVVYFLISVMAFGFGYGMMQDAKSQGNAPIAFVCFGIFLLCSILLGRDKHRIKKMYNQGLLQKNAPGIEPIKNEDFDVENTINKD